jgi:aspartyl-tRNA(Asn)/glutamyl-tRNA(Gln) amidotransferase subunit A
MYLADVYVCAISLSGLPAMSMPAGRDEVLPIGAQIIAPHFDEARMLSAAGALERVLRPEQEVRG